MRNTRVVISTRTQVNDLSYSCLLGDVDQILALPQHVDRVAGCHEDAVNAFESRRKSLKPVKVQIHKRDAE